MVEINDLEKELIEEFGEPVEAFQPHAYYDPDGDCMEFQVGNNPFHARRLDNWVTIYYDDETDEIVGGQIKNVQQLISIYPGIDIDFIGNAVKVSIILRASAWRVGDKTIKAAYKTVIELTEQSITEPVEMCV